MASTLESSIYTENLLFGQDCKIDILSNLIIIRSLTCSPLLKCCGVCKIWRKKITVQVTLYHEYIMVWYHEYIMVWYHKYVMAWYHEYIMGTVMPFSANQMVSSMQSSLVTLSYSCNHHFHWMVHRIIPMTHNGVSSDLPCHNILVKGNKWEIWTKSDWILSRLYSNHWLLS